MAITTNKMFLDKTGLGIFWGIIKNHLATKADKTAAVGSFSDTVYTGTNATITATAVDGTTVLDTIVLNAATTTNAGLMSATDKANLDSLKETIDANTDFKGLKINDVQVATEKEANLKIAYVPKTETTNAKIKLYDANTEAAVSEIDASDFIKDGMISSVDIVEHEGKKQIKLEWNTEAGKDVTYIPVDDMVKTYSAGEGLDLTDDTFKLVAATETTLGGIKTGYTAAEGAKNYAVEVDGNGNAYVAVPWENDNTEYTAKSGNTLVELELTGTEFSINETALTGAIEGLQTTKVDAAEGDDYVEASVDGTTVKVAATQDLKDAVAAANSAVQTITGGTGIDATPTSAEDHTGYTIALDDATVASLGKADTAVQNVKHADGETLINVSEKSDNVITVSATDALKNAVEAANSAVQSASGDDYVAASVDGTEVKVAATQDLKDAVAAANSALQEITIGSITLNQSNNGTVEHDAFVDAFAMTEADIYAACDLEVPNA